MQAPYRRAAIDPVSDADAATELTELAAVDAAFDTDDDRLAAYYSYPDDLDRCWVRANMISSLDGGATDDGKSGGLAGPGDRALFARMRQEADVIVVGASTVRIENYSGRTDVARRNDRTASAAGRPRCRPSPSSPTPPTSSTTPSCSPAPRCRR